jgi:uncharacterized protein
MTEFKIGRDSISFWIRVKPRAQRDQLKMGSDGELVLELHAPPVEGAANEACIKFMAESLRVPKSNVELVAGDKSRRKLLRISGQSGEEMKSRLESLARGITRRDD